VAGAVLHVPALQPAPGSHFLSQEPQALGSVLVSTHAVLHMVGTYEKHWQPPSMTLAFLTQAESVGASPGDIASPPPVDDEFPLAPEVPAPALPPVPFEPPLPLGGTGVVSSLLHAATRVPNNAIAIVSRERAMFVPPVRKGAAPFVTRRAQSRL
jgi:hypothetical protein